ncbi:hypothetical protein V3Q90_13640 [Flavobacterium oreochromis]|uniref:hypothetical protein n=1 Tax=Flavobacterium oreochromis TaxID=2906078 RepID=UPI0013F5C63E
MQLKLELSSQSNYPIQGLLVRGETVSQWLVAFDQLGIQEQNLRFYPIPSREANVLYGCLVIGNITEKMKDNLGVHQLLQGIENTLFIPEFTTVSPTMSQTDFSTLFEEGIFLMHPEVGFYQLEAPIDWSVLLDFSFTEKEVTIVAPLKQVYIPSMVRSIFVEKKEEDIEKKMLEMIQGDGATAEDSPFNLDKLMKGNAKEMDKFLACLEKNPDLALKFALPLDIIGSSRGNLLGKYEFRGSNFLSDLSKDLSEGIGKIGTKIKGINSISGIFIAIFISRLLMSMSKGMIGSLVSGLAFVVVLVVLLFLLSFIFLGSSENFSGSRSGNGGSSVLLENKKFEALRKQYEKLAEDYIQKGQYHKASHIYLKLLKDTNKAGKALEAGKFYNDAASIYEKENYLRIEAARCYELGHSYQKAIAIYQTYKNYEEKIADLYRLLANEEEALKYYTIVLDRLKSEHKYVQASDLLIYKLDRFEEGQKWLLEGWHNSKHKHQCLTKYINNIEEDESKIIAIHSLYTNVVTDANSNQFLDVLKTLFNSVPNLQNCITPLAFEVITNRMEKHPSIINTLVHFVPENYLLRDDISIYNLKKKR